MMIDIKKIKNLKIIPTKEKLDNNWSEIKSFKNRLLQNSDWINMPDNDLQDDIVRLWVEWRHRVRRVDEFIITDVDKASEYLQDLQNNQPPIIYKNDTYSTIEHYKEALQKLLFNVIKKATDGIYELTDSRELLMERFEEALRFLNGKKENNFLIAMEVEYTGLSEQDVVDKFLLDRKNYLIKLITIEKVKKKYLKIIDSVENFKECDRTRNELITLNTKKWI